MVRNSIFCEHANENPSGPCPCDDDCFCKQPGNMCNKANKTPVVQKENDIEKRLAKLEEKVSDLVEAMYQINKGRRGYGR